MSVDLHPLRFISLCSGGGGLDRAVELAIPGAGACLYVERESFACAALVAQIEDGALASAPIWSDVTTLRGRAWRGLVDGVIGGIPCQEWSLAGQRRGDTGERDLWPPTRRIIVQSRPWFVLIENVPGMLTAGKGKLPGAYRVQRDLRRLGFEVAGGLFRASDVGLPHQRERLFILGVALAEPDRRQRWEQEQRGASSTDAPGPSVGAPERARWSVSSPGPALDAGCEPESRRGGLASATSPGRKGRGPTGDRPGECEAAERGGEHLGDTPRQHGRIYSGQREDRFGETDARGRGGSLERPFLRPPAPADLDAWRIVAEQSPRLLPAVSRHDLFEIEVRAARAAADGDPPQGRVEAGGDQTPAAALDPSGPYGLCAPVVQAVAERTLRGVVDGMAPRIDRLRLLGNGVVPACGALALRTLALELSARSPGAAELVRLMEADR